MKDNTSDKRNENSSALLYVLTALFIGVLIFAYYFNSNKTDQVLEKNSKYFQERVVALGIENVGYPKEGFDANLLRKAFSGLSVSDFNEVETLEGYYEVSGDVLTFVRDSEESVTSVERTISEKGYATLLVNISTRVGISLIDETAIDVLIEIINPLKNLEARINKGVSKFGVTVVPLVILEDSRCPEDVVCIQAGTVRLRTLLSSGSGEAEQIFSLGEPITTEVEEIVLKQVFPYPNSLEVISPSEYRFIFEISKREFSLDESFIAERFEDKIVYGFDQSSNNIELLKNHCSSLGGFFNECGSPCDVSAQACITVCALTCEF